MDNKWTNVKQTDTREPLLSSDQLTSNDRGRSGSGYGTIKSTTADNDLSAPNINKPKSTHAVLDTPSNRVHWRYKHEILLTSVCYMAAISGGLVMGFSSPTVPLLKAQGVLDDDQATWYESMVTLGGIVGSLFSCWSLEAIGRKVSTLLTVIPCAIGWICLIVADSYVLLYVGRFMTGLGGAMSVITCVLYMTETSSKEIRGAVVMGFQLATNLGTLSLYAMGLVLDTKWLATVAMFPTVLLGLGLLFTADSPRWLIKKGRHSEAAASLAWLRSTSQDNIKSEMDEIKSSIEQYELKSMHSTVGQEILRLKKSLAIVVALFIFAQFSGVTVVMFNTQEIFANAGFKHSDVADGSIPPIIIASIQVLSIFIGTFVVDRIGRKPLQIIGGVLLTASTATMGLYFYFRTSLEQDYSWISLLAGIIFMSTYSPTWGATGWLMLGEIIPMRFRSLFSGIASAVAWTSAFVVVKLYQVIIDAFGWHGLFWLFSSICVLGTIFSCICMPETKRKSLEDIEREFNA